MIIDDRYLGDGVYASYDGMHIILDLRAQPPVVPVTQIALEAPVFDALIKFNDDLQTMLSDLADAEAQTDDGVAP